RQFQRPAFRPLRDGVLEVREVVAARGGDTPGLRRQVADHAADDRASALLAHLRRERPEQRGDHSGLDLALLEEGKGGHGAIVGQVSNLSDEEDRLETCPTERQTAPATLTGARRPRTLTASREVSN